MADLDAMRARVADPATFTEAQRRMDAINDRIDFPAAGKVLTGAINARNPKAKVFLLRQAAATLAKAAAPDVPCKPGCNACCNMGTLLSPVEAQQIARETGAKFTMPAKFADFGHKDKYSGVPCTFLTPTGCGIYAHRPFACRIHYALDKDELLCQITPEAPKMPMFNTMELDKAYVLTFSPGRDAAKMVYADIREFFPQGLK